MSTLTPFKTTCRIHIRGPQTDTCIECVTAVDVNFMGHRQGDCIVAECWWHNNPDYLMLEIPMVSWDGKLEATHRRRR